MKALNGSGGSTKGAGIIGAWNGLYDAGFRPDIISGISVSAIMAVPYALGKRDKIKEVFLNIDLDDIFSKKPVNKKGKITLCAIARVIIGKALGNQSAIIDLLSELVTEKEFMHFKSSAYYPEVIIMAVDFKTASRVFKRVKSLTYKEYLQYTLASASIPGYTPPVEIDGHVLYDGGVRDHIISHYIMEHYKVTENISVYSRPKNFNNIEKNWKHKNEFVDPILRTLDILNLEVSKNDELLEISIAKEKGIDNKVIYLPKVLQSLYDVDKGRLGELYDKGYKAGYELFGAKLF